MTGRIGRNDATRRLAFLAFAAVAWLGLGSATGSAQTAPGYCPVQADVAPGSCVCPSNTTWQATQASCAAGRCGCAMGLQWNGSYCAQPPPPPPPPPPMCQGGCRPNQVCVNGACVGTGDLRFTLTWDQPGDVDLYVVTPGGRTISYRARQADSGTLDRDDRTGTGPENVFWADDPPAGTYLVCVNPYRIQRPTNFTVQVVRSGLPTQTMQGSLPSSRQPSGCQQGGRDFLGAGPLFALCDRVARELLSPGRASIVVVTLPERLVLEETRELCDALAHEVGLAPERVAVNRMPLPVAPESLADALSLASTHGPLAPAARALADTLSARASARAEAEAALAALALPRHALWHIPAAPVDPSAHDVARWLRAEGAP